MIFLNANDQYNYKFITDRLEFLGVAVRSVDTKNLGKCEIKFYYPPNSVFKVLQTFEIYFKPYFDEVDYDHFSVDLRAFRPGLFIDIYATTIEITMVITVLITHIDKKRRRQDPYTQQYFKVFHNKG